MLGFLVIWTVFLHLETISKYKSTSPGIFSFLAHEVRSVSLYHPFPVLQAKVVAARMGHRYSPPPDRPVLPTRSPSCSVTHSHTACAVPGVQIATEANEKHGAYWGKQHENNPTDISYNPNKHNKTSREYDTDLF